MVEIPSLLGIISGTFGLPIVAIQNSWSGYGAGKLNDLVYINSVFGSRLLGVLVSWVLVQKSTAFRGFLQV